MKSLCISAAVLFFVYATLVCARPWTPDDDAILGIPVNGAVQIHTQTLGIGHLQIHFANPVVKMDQVELNKQNWTMVTIDGETRLWQAGKPALPLISRLIRLPNTGNVQLKVTLGEYDEYHNIDVLPQQPIYLKSTGNHFEPTDYTFDNEVYNKDEWYPSQIAGLTSPQVMRDARVALLAVQPVQYNPVTRTLRVYKAIDVETLPVGGQGENELIQDRTHPVPSFAGIYDEVIGAGDLADEARRSPPGKILILCRPAVAAIAQQLADWKTQAGRPCQVITTTLTNATTIHDSLILPMYNSGTPSLEVVLVVGDGGTTANNYEFPAFSWSWTGPYAEMIYTDHYYGCLSTSTTFGANILASWWSGRFSATTDAQFQTMVNRTLNYERTPYLGPTGTDTTWYNTGWGYAGISLNNYTIPSCIRFCLQCMQARGLTNLLYDEHNGSISTALMDTRLDNGALFWAHRPSWDGEISNSDVDGITNTNKPWIGFNLSYYNGEWYGTGSTGLQEEVTRLGSPAAPKGALASMSMQSEGGFTAVYNIAAAGTFYALGYLNATIAGDLYFQAKYQLYRNLGYGMAASPTPAELSILANNPHGDLSVHFYTGVPRSITANIPTSIGIGQNQLAIQVMRGATPAIGALVTAWKKNAGGTNETYVRDITDDSGRVDFTLTNATAGNMLVTVVGNQVGQNLIPLLDTVQVIQSATDLAFSNLTIVDDTTSGRAGNNNGTANPGEIVDLNVQLINRGTTTATGISGVLSCADPRIIILNTSTSWNSDSAGTTAGSNAPFRIHLLGGFRDNESIALQLSLTTTQGNRTIDVPVTVRSIRMAYMAQTLNPAVLNPGQSADLSITVRNNGGLATGSTTASLFSLSPYLTVTTSSATFTGLPVGTNVSNPAGQLFHVSASARAIRGTVANLGTSLTSGFVSDTIYFTVTLGTRLSTDPAGPDPYGYYAYDITDTAYTMIVPNYSWQEIIPTYGGTGTRLPITDYTTNDLAVVERLPFTTNYYGTSYDSVTICDNGWLAFGAQRSPDVGHQPYNNSLNWHLPAQEGPKNIVAVNWCDQSNAGVSEGTYVKSDTANHRYIVTWKTTTVNTPSSQEYQLIIYDQRYFTTPTNDAPLKFQYKTFRPAAYSGDEFGVSYATVGIADSTYTRALEYCYWNVYNPGCAPIPVGTNNSNFAILFTTENVIRGNFAGTVLRASDNQPIRGATVFMLNYGRSTVTDSLGHYEMTDLQIGSYQVRASAFGYNASTDTVTIHDSLTSTLNFLLTNPGIRLSVNDTTVRANDSIYAVLLDSGQTSNQQIFIRNTGNGTLTWSANLTVDDGSNEIDSLWQPLYSFNASQACGGDNLLSGVAFDGNNFWITGTNNYNLPHHLYKLDRNGTLLHTYNCPDSTGLFGWHDLSWDGHYLYSSYSSYIDKIDTSNGQIVRRFVADVNPVRAIAVDTAGGVLYYCDQASPIYKIRLNDGVALGSISNPNGGGVYGLAWYPTDPDGLNLYAFVRDSLAHSIGSRIFKINPTSGTAVRSVSLGLPNERAAGLEISSTWNPLLWTAASVLQNSAGCRVAVYALNFNSSWVTYNPHNDAEPPGHTDTVSVHLNSRNMPAGRFQVGLQFVNNSVDSSVTVPLVMMVTPYSGIKEANGTVPNEFSLWQNYPNPFNPKTSIKFTIPYTTNVRLNVFDVQGREVGRLVSNDFIQAGTHVITFDGSKLASGIYFYRITSGTYVSTKKMVLLK